MSGRINCPSVQSVCRLALIESNRTSLDDANNSRKYSDRQISLEHDLSGESTKTRQRDCHSQAACEPAEFCCKSSVVLSLERPSTGQFGRKFEVSGSTRLETAASETIEGCKFSDESKRWTAAVAVQAGRMGMTERVAEGKTTKGGDDCWQSENDSRRQFRSLNKIRSKRNNKLSAVTGTKVTETNWIPSTMCAALALIAIMVLANGGPGVECVDCFKCSSRNGSNPACEDPFHNLNTTRVISPFLPDPPPKVIYHTPCHAGKKGRDGVFPASACIKLTGIFDATGETLVVRHCALDSGTLTQDTELARMSHCGKFQFEGDMLRGCVLACPEDACNSATRIQAQTGYNMATYWLTALAFGVIVYTQANQRTINLN